ncbi:hypothetical protein [Sulfuricurvum sp.]|uniref:hypothetical protein n=1 Tax=Sulfuricurvum sp. TaxID=2025608 RepID=UPI0025EABEB8|nr:hypothetical protein [Sulfuricurvum sp.]
MFDAIMGGIIAIILSIVANILTPYFQNIFKITPASVPDVSEPTFPESDSVSVEESRAINRAKLDIALNKIFFYGYSYFVMYMAFYVPISLHGGLLNPNVNLIDSKFAIDFIINKDNLSMISAIFGVFAYFPFWKLSQLMANFLSSIVTKFIFISELRYLALTAFMMIFWAFFIAGNVTWILNEQATWFNSIKSSLLLWVLLFFAIISNKR